MKDCQARLLYNPGGLLLAMYAKKIKYVHFYAYHNSIQNNQNVCSQKDKWIKEMLCSKL